jgi:hypothetical protein
MLFDADEHQVQQDMNSTRAKTGIAVNLHYVRTGRKGTPAILSRDQVKAMCKKFSRNQNGNFEDSADVGKNGEIDNLYEFLEESGCHYVSLLARAPVPEASSRASSDAPPPNDAARGKPRLFNETRVGSYTEQEDIDIGTNYEEQEMLHIVSDHRRVLQIKDSQEMMVGIAFAMPFEIQQFKLFPICCHIDATSDTNKEGCPLVTLTSKDAYGKMFIVLHAFPPSEQSWSFKWLFQTACPTLLGKKVMKKIRIIVTDGDSQEIAQLDDAIKKFFPEANRIRCSWHIIYKGWHKRVKAPLGGTSHKKRALHLKGQSRPKGPPLSGLNKTARTMYQWMFSWAHPSYCETDKEYYVSKALFFTFVQSREVKEILGSVYVEAIINFARKNVLPQEDQMSYFKPHDLFHLETHTNCAHKGTNIGMKNCAAPVMPQNRLDRAVKTLHLNAEIKAANTSIKISQK